MPNWDFIRTLLAYSKREDGQTMAEYAIILGVIAAGVILAIGFLSGGIENAINNIVDVLPGGGE